VGGFRLLEEDAEVWRAKRGRWSGRKRLGRRKFKVEGCRCGGGRGLLCGGLFLLVLLLRKKSARIKHLCMNWPE